MNSVVLNGIKSAENTWTFEGLPVGRFRALLDDGIGHSEEFELDVLGENVSASATFKRTSGVRIDVIDESGLRLYDVDQISIRGTTHEGKLFALRLPRATRVSAGASDSELPSPSFPIPPGEYTVFAIKFGYETASASVTVEAGRVSSATVRVIQQ